VLASRRKSVTNLSSKGLQLGRVQRLGAVLFSSIQGGFSALH
jgi:hypothetical protein